MNRSTQRRNNYIRGYEMPAAAKAPPMIAPGILCPKCGSAMLDDRRNKRTDKSPDYTCSNMLCVETGKNGKSYRTAIWAKDAGNGKPPVAKVSNVPNQQLPPLLQNQEAEDAAELQSKIGPPEKPKLTQLYLDATTFFLDRIVPKFEEEGIGLSDTAVVAGIATLFIAASKER